MKEADTQQIIPPDFVRKMKFYLTSPQPCPYLPGKMERKVFANLAVDSAVRGPAKIVVRPERVRISTDAPTGPAVTATVTDLTFQGAMVRLALETADNAPIVAHIGHDQDLLRERFRLTAARPCADLASSVTTARR